MQIIEKLMPERELPPELAKEYEQAKTILSDALKELNPKSVTTKPDGTVVITL